MGRIRRHIKFIAVSTVRPRIIFKKILETCWKNAKCIKLLQNTIQLRFCDDSDELSGSFVRFEECKEIP